MRAWLTKVGLGNQSAECPSPQTATKSASARGSESAGAHSLPHAAMPDGLVWVQPEEQEQIARMRIALQDELAAALPELRHDHQFLRFLRGHGGFEKAVEKMRLY